MSRNYTFLQNQICLTMKWLSCLTIRLSETKTWYNTTTIIWVAYRSPSHIPPKLTKVSNKVPPNYTILLM